MTIKNLISDFKKINSLNLFHGRIVLYLLYMEKKCRIKVIFKILRRLIIQHGYHCEISPANFVNLNDIASLRLPHPFLIIVHNTARLGCNCTLFHNVTIGVIESQGIIKAAQLGNNCYIGCGATILGYVNIGDNVKIGAQTIVLRDISSNETVTGIYK